MNLEVIFEYFSQYGLLFLFIIVFLEYLNLPGLPAGIIMPAAGVLIDKGHINFFTAIVVSVLAGLLGSICLYAIGRYGGTVLLEKYIKKFPNQKQYIYKISEEVKRRGNYGVLISKLIPVARTLVSIPAGVFKINFLEFSIFSTIGIIIWNTAFISFGYIFSDVIFK